MSEALRDKRQPLVALYNLMAWRAAAEELANPGTHKTSVLSDIRYQVFGQPDLYSVRHLPHSNDTVTLGDGLPYFLTDMIANEDEEQEPAMKLHEAIARSFSEFFDNIDENGVRISWLQSQSGVQAFEDLALHIYSLPKDEEFTNEAFLNWFRTNIVNKGALSSTRRE